MFMESLEWYDTTGEEVVHRFPAERTADPGAGAQLIVRADQLALLHDGSRERERFEPGRHTLPGPSRAFAPPAAGASDLRVEAARHDLCFVSQKLFARIPWATCARVAAGASSIADTELRAEGWMSVRVIDPEALLSRLDPRVTSITIRDLGARLGEALGVGLQGQDTTLAGPPTDTELAIERLAASLQPGLTDDCSRWGLDLVDFGIGRAVVDGHEIVSPAPVHDGDPLGAPAASAQGYCTACGGSLRHGDRFCGRCGRRVAVGAEHDPAVGCE